MVVGRREGARRNILKTHLKDLDARALTGRRGELLTRRRSFIRRRNNLPTRVLFPRAPARLRPAPRIPNYHRVPRKRKQEEGIFQSRAVNH